MRSMLHEVRRTDEALDLIARREAQDWDDAVLAALASLAFAADEQQIPDPPSLDLAAAGRAIPDLSTSDSPRRPPAANLPGPDWAADERATSRTRRGGFALTATVALVLSSSGLAAAVTGDALAPLHYVAKQILRLAPDGSGQFPGWDLDGVGPLFMPLRHIGSATALDANDEAGRLSSRSGGSAWYDGGRWPTWAYGTPGGAAHHPPSSGSDGGRIPRDGPPSKTSGHQPPISPAPPGVIVHRVPSMPSSPSPPSSPSVPAGSQHHHGTSGQTLRAPVDESPPRGTPTHQAPPAGSAAVGTGVAAAPVAAAATVVPSPAVAPVGVPPLK